MEQTTIKANRWITLNDFQEVIGKQLCVTERGRHSSVKCHTKFESYIHFEFKKDKVVGQFGMVRIQNFSILFALSVKVTSTVT